MPEQVFRAPGFYDREIDLSTKTAAPLGVPYAIVGGAEKGPAFVPVSLGSKDDFTVKFGPQNPKYAGTYGANKVLDNRDSIIYLRVLGAGANTLSADFETTRTAGTVKNAGMKLVSSVVGGGDNRHRGAVQFIAAKHVVTASEAFGYPMFTDNDSYTLAANAAYLTRGVLFTTADARGMIMDTNEAWGSSLDDAATIDDTSTNATYRKFKFAISSSAGSAWASTDGFSGVRIYTASLDPTNSDYIGKVLNTDPERFETEKHVLYADFAVDAELASVASGSGNNNSVVLLSGSSVVSTTSGVPGQSFRDAFGRFDVRYRTPKTTNFISQPFGSTEYDLFSVEALDDGDYANKKYKISISNLRASTDPRNPYGTFALLVRNFNDTDLDMKVLEQYNNLTINPDDENYVGRVVGDAKVYYNFDVENEDDRRLVRSGKFGNRSKYVRMVMHHDVENKLVPPTSLPFGFRGLPVLNTNTLGTDTNPAATVTRLAGSGSFLTGSVVPPVPFRFKVTRGTINDAGVFTGQPGPTEIVDSRFFWGVKFERNTNVFNPNISNEQNGIVSSLTKFMGLGEMDVLYTGSYADSFNDNKFTLARVALSITSTNNLTASADVHMREAAYIRNGVTATSEYLISDGTWGNRYTFASFLSSQDQDHLSAFNKFTDYMKFTNVMYGGWDGINIFDKNAARFNDRATSTESSSVGYGGAHPSYVSPGSDVNNFSGTGLDNNAIVSYKAAVDILTEPNISNMNLLAIPGIREPLVVDYTSDKVQNKHQLSFFVGDIPYYDFNLVRIFDGEANRFIDNEKTAEEFDGRAIDVNSMGVYFPNVIVDDTTNNKKVVVPASIAALGAISYNDKVAYPWWAPAGFNRAALDFVFLTQSKLRQPDRNKMYDSRINTIVKFPNEGFVIFSQKTLQQAKTALDSINVKRMVLEVKRMVVEAGTRIIFEQNTPDLRVRFSTTASSLLATVQARQGIERFKVICDDSNNSVTDVDNNRMNGRIEFKPVRAVEFIQIDFVVLPSGVSFL